MYNNHELKIVLFEPTSVFTDLEVSGGPEGGIVVNSTNPGTVDR